ncbi:MAG: aminotransferase class I/II-fold pyridoxal phosphate-dependent enzyme [Eubacteriales bacterium]|nr:aminotransferase class I/II-fold pyridoxal phosphate-dependent enzyme [Eubacteriales bacterium]
MARTSISDRVGGAAFKSRHEKTPIEAALIDYTRRRVVPFDVPGHKQGRGTPGLAEFLGEKCVSVDVNSSKPLDNLSHPTSVIKEAEDLAADAFGCSGAFFLVGGTTASVQAMILSCCGEGDSIIMPRNVHKSAINAAILSGCVPIYVNPGIDTALGIPLGMKLEDIEKAIRENPGAKAVFVNNPTYYGVCSDLSGIIEAAHRAGMLVLCDEAHGTHFYFHDDLPAAAMHLGADMAAVSVHKTGGSLTQSSMLLYNGARLNADHLRVVINLTQTTSASYLLLSSLDIARKNLALNGEATFSKVLQIAEYARGEINAIGGYYAFSSEIAGHAAAADFDRTKLSVHTLGLGLAGFEVYDILRDEYGIQIEFGDVANFLAIISVGDSNLAIERLVAALAEIKRRKPGRRTDMFDHEYISPVVSITPKQAFFAKKKKAVLRESAGAVSGEFVMCYPPGIPVIAPGEVITQEIIDYILYAQKKGALLTGTEDMDLRYINILD